MWQLVSYIHSALINNVKSPSTRRCISRVSYIYIDGVNATYPRVLLNLFRSSVRKWIFFWRILIHSEVGSTGR